MPFTPYKPINTLSTEEVGASRVSGFKPYTPPKEEPIQVPQKQSLFGRLQTKVKGIALGVYKDIKQIVLESGEKGAEQLEAGLQAKSPAEQLKAGANIAGTVARGAGELVFGTPLKAAFRALPTPIQDELKSRAGVFAEKLKVPEIAEAYSEWSTKHPDAAQQLENVINIAALIPMTGAATKGLAETKAGIKEVIPTVEKLAAKGATALEESASKQTFQEAMEITKPIFTKSEAKKMIVAGKGEETFLGGVSIKPTSEDVRIAESVQNIISKNNKPSVNIQALKNETSNIAENVKTNLASNNRGFNEKQLKSALGSAKENSRVIFGTDKTLESAYDSVVDEMMIQINKNPKNLAGLWESRKQFDNIIKSKFPNLLSDNAGDNIRRNAVKDVRQTLNEFIDTNAPDAGFGDALRKMDDMFEARDRIAAQVAGSVNKNVIERIESAIRKSPLVMAGLPTGITIAGFTGLLTNPVTIGALISYGGYKTAKGIITSKTVKTILAKTLRTIEKEAGRFNVADKAAIQELINQLPD